MCTEFEQNRLTFISKSGPVSQAEALNSILRHLLNIHRIEIPTVLFRRSVRSGETRDSTSGARKTRLVERPRNPSPFFPFTPLQPNLVTASQLTGRLEQASVLCFGKVQERERRKRKHNLKIQKEGDEKADWEGLEN